MTAATAAIAGAGVPTLPATSKGRVMGKVYAASASRFSDRDSIPTG